MPPMATSVRQGWPRAANSFATNTTDHPMMRYTAVDSIRGALIHSILASTPASATPQRIRQNRVPLGWGSSTTQKGV